MVDLSILTGSSGRKLRQDELVVLVPFDRVVIGNEVLLYRWKVAARESGGPLLARPLRRVQVQSPLSWWGSVA